MKRGEVCAFVKFNTPSVGGEIEKQRPAVIVSNDAANKNLNCLQIVPLTSNIEKLYPSEAYVMLNYNNEIAIKTSASDNVIKLLLFSVSS